MFPVVSTATITRRCRRFVERVFQRTEAALLVVRAGVFNCRLTSGTDLWSPHARGDAADLFPKVATVESLDRIAHAAIRQATKRTKANRGRKCPIVHVIWNRSEWTRDLGVHAYGGVPHTGHVHIGFSFSSPIKPACAG